MRLAFHTVDVFTRQRFGGNPLAVVLDADDLTTAQMQSIAREFNYSETAFVLCPADPRHTAHVRIFTPTTEVPFAGHPNVGAAFVLARLAGDGTPDELVFEEAAGLVRARVLRRDGRVDQIQLTAPQPLSVGRPFARGAVAAAVGLSATDLSIDLHPPRLASVGLGFLLAEVRSRQALRRARPDVAAFTRILPAGGADAIYLYCRETDPSDLSADLTARMFAPFDGLPEDPATGSATAAACALIASLEPGGVRRFEVAQGVDMGRPSRMTVEVDEGHVVRISGACAPVMQGFLSI